MKKGLREGIDRTLSEIPYLFSGRAPEECCLQGIFQVSQ